MFANNKTKFVLCVYFNFQVNLNSALKYKCHRLKGFSLIFNVEPELEYVSKKISTNTINQNQ